MTDDAKEKRWTVRKLFALQRALAGPALTRADVLVLAVVLEYLSGIHGLAWPSVETLHEVTGLTRRAVQLSLRRLETAGIISTERGGGAGYSNRYAVDLDLAVSPFQDRIKAAAERAKARSPFRNEKGEQPRKKGEESRPKGRTALRPNPLMNPLMNPLN